MLNFQCWSTYFALAYRQIFIFKFPQVVRMYIIYFEIVEEFYGFEFYIYNKKTSMIKKYFSLERGNKNCSFNWSFIKWFLYTSTC